MTKLAINSPVAIKNIPTSAHHIQLFMRFKLTLLWIFVSIYSSVVSMAQTTTVSKEEALAIAQNQFDGQDCDYYILNDNNPDLWTIFIDAEPMKGWSHECYTIKIPKQLSEENKSSFSPEKTLLDFAPEGDYQPLLTKNRYGDNACFKPTVRNDIQLQDTKSVAERTYALIINGGVNKTVNRERFWNDCSFIYQTLVNKYGVPKTNIYPIMSDGTDPAEDMMNNDNISHSSQSLDLDFDGEAEIEYAATKTNIQTVLNHIDSIIKKDDHLFIFVIDHGGHSVLKNELSGETTYLNSYICLWGNSNNEENKLYDYELAEMLEPFSSKFVNLNIVLGQCYSGGFIEQLNHLNCVVATACKKDEKSYSLQDLPYDAFVYHWICAVNGATPNKISVNADTDFNGIVTMEEAFIYANENDHERETPQFISSPTSIGEDLGFNNIPNSVDLYIKDCNLDTGKEPNTVTPMFWISPSIWVRNQNDSISIHENPVYSLKHNKAYIYVKIDNRGKEDFNGQGKWVHIYWAYASTGLTTETWKGQELYNGKPTGGHLGAKQIGQIKSGEYGIVMFDWELTSIMDNLPNDNHHFCLFAKIMDQYEDDGYVPGTVYFEQWNSNDQAQRNISIIDSSSFELATTVFIRNTVSVDRMYSLEFIPQTIIDKTLFQHGFVEMTLPSSLNPQFDTSVGVIQIEQPQNSGCYKVAFTASENKLGPITMKSGDIKDVAIKFNFTNMTDGLIKGYAYTCNLIQRDVRGEIIGGETFVIQPPGKATAALRIMATDNSNGGFDLTADMEDLQTVTWFDESLNCIGESKNISLPAIKETKQITAVGKNNSGELTSDVICLNPRHGISAISRVPEGIIVELFGEILTNSEVSAVSIIDGVTADSKFLSSVDSVVTLEVPSNSNRIYVVNYTQNGEIIDSKKINIYP